MNIVLMILPLCAALIIAAWFLIPQTRSGTHSYVFDGSLDEVWAVYTDPESQVSWRDDVKEVRDFSGTLGNRKWTEVDERGLEISFVETHFEPPYRLELQTQSKGYFSGKYVATFKEIEGGKVVGEFTETATAENFVARLMAFIFVNPKKLIERYGDAAQREILRRRA